MDDQPDTHTHTHNTHKRQTSLAQLEFEPAVPETHALDRTITGTGTTQIHVHK